MSNIFIILKVKEQAFRIIEESLKTAVTVTEEGEKDERSNGTN